MIGKSFRTELIRSNISRSPRRVAFPSPNDETNRLSPITGNQSDPGHGGQPRPIHLHKLFASNVYGIEQLKETLPKPVFAKLLELMKGSCPLDKTTADAVAHAVKVWAIEKGATHFTHWFQPQTNSTAEKHDSFLNLNFSSNGACLNATAVETFSGSQLVQAEPDASSFPNGGLRTTFEARGYTVWDTNSPMFLQEGPHGTRILYIPSVFISYNGEALDEKTVLLRSCDAVSHLALKLLRLIGDNTTTKVHTTLGCEQEFFLVDRSTYSMRPDLKMTGRTLIGSPPAKHQQLEDHYFGNIPSRVLAAMSEAEIELLKIGVPFKTRHNEVAPAQFEMAPIFEETAVAVDHNLLTMEILHKVAHRHGLKALFHEKPFKGVNGSGKHCNWSLCTDTGLNLLEPGENPQDNPAFLLVLVAILTGLKDHASLINCAIASASNEHRLGANEAPPGIISAFLGQHLDNVLECIETGKPTGREINPEKVAVRVGGKSIDLKIAHLPNIHRDLTDRNRTSPFAFTGNKFELRAVGSSQTPAFPVAMLNAAVASGMQDVIEALRKASKGQPPSKEIIYSVIKEFIVKSKPIRFEGDNYSNEWKAEAAKRGLLNASIAPQAFEQLLKPENKKMLVEKLFLLSESELSQRFEVLCEKYVKALLIEAKTMRNMVVQSLLPSVFKYRRDLISTVTAIQEAKQEKKIIPELVIYNRLDELTMALNAGIDQLNESIKIVEVKLAEDPIGIDEHRHALSVSYIAAENLKPAMEKVRRAADSIEDDLDEELYPFPKYVDLLF